MATNPLPVRASEQRLHVTNEGDEVKVEMVGSSRTGLPGRTPDGYAVIPSTLSVHELTQRFIRSTHREEKRALVDRIGSTKPSEMQDLRSLFNLYDRGVPLAQPAIMRSLGLLSPRDQALAPYFNSLLEDEDPSFQLFGVAGAVRLRSPDSLPYLRKLASQPFQHPRPALMMATPDSSRWHARFDALHALASWRHDKETFRLLLKRSKEAPPAAALLARYYWKESLSRILKWSRSKRREDRERAASAWQADVPVEDLRSTSGELRSIVEDRKQPFESRHRASIKLGFAADDAEVERLLKAREDAKDKKTRQLLTAALFASRHPKVIPLLVEFVKTDPDPLRRAGALVELRDMMPKPEFRSLLEWMAANEKDSENRGAALRELRSP